MRLNVGNVAKLLVLGGNFTVEGAEHKEDLEHQHQNTHHGQYNLQTHQKGELSPGVSFKGVHNLIHTYQKLLPLLVNLLNAGQQVVYPLRAVHCFKQCSLMGLHLRKELLNGFTPERRKFQKVATLLKSPVHFVPGFGEILQLHNLLWVAGHQGTVGRFHDLLT